MLNCSGKGWRSALGVAGEGGRKYKFVLKIEKKKKKDKKKETETTECRTPTASYCAVFSKFFFKNRTFFFGGNQKSPFIEEGEGEGGKLLSSFFMINLSPYRKSDEAQLLRGSRWGILFHLVSLSPLIKKNSLVRHT